MESYTAIQHITTT